VEPLAGTLVADFTRNLPGPFASRELLRLGARVVRIEAPTGDPVRDVAPAWDAALNAGKESVVWDRERDAQLGPALCARADVVLEGFRPGVAERLGVGASAVPVSVVYCSITGFGSGDLRAGHDLNYMGWAGALAPTAPAMPPLPVADLAAGGLTAVVRILGALIERTRTGTGARIVVSMTHGAHELAQFAGPLTGSLACYRIYECADGRFLTIAALEPTFWSRLCERGRPPALGEHTDAWRRELASNEG
jgi:alpha-methylacyl-CoA racemase